MYWNFVIVALILAISIYLTSYFMDFGTSSSNQNNWYRSLKMPSFQPPPIVFSVIWTILYIILWYTVSVSYPKDQSILYYFILLSILLVLWSFVFFRLKNLWGATLVLIITFFVAWIIWSKIVKVSKTQTNSTLFLLFNTWILIAALLNINIAINNY